jgi:adenylate cyclase
MVASSVSIGWLVAIVEELAIQERHGRLQLDAAHQSLASLNSSLEEQVVRQVEEIDSLNRLRRFLSPQVAEAVLRDGSGGFLQPHRERIAVVFCDLRGFTGFASEVAPEEVIEVLHVWFTTVGELFRRYDATVGTVAGDGVMAYFGDPVPHDDPAGAAVAMAVELREPMERQRASWDRRGFSLGYGVGIAYGYATMGTIGFDGRHEYTPLGPVVNLASRLCGAAADGEILIDDRAHVAVSDRVVAAERLVDLRGYRTAIAAHNVCEWLPTGRLLSQTSGQG